MSRSVNSRTIGQISKLQARAANDFAQALSGCSAQKDIQIDHLSQSQWPIFIYVLEPVHLRKLITIHSEVA
jgi:hypothetical protein